MIQALSLVNFKCFSSLPLTLSRLNVFAGINGCGKSTVIQSLLAIRQSIQSGSILQDRIQLRGSLADLGTAGEVYCAQPSSDLIEIVVKHSGGSAIELRSPKPTERAGEYFLQLQSRVPSEKFVSLFTEPFNYLNAERIGPRKVFSIPPAEGHPLWVGKRGENAPFIVSSETKETIITNQWLILESADGKEYPTIQFQWPLWMSRLFPGFDAESEIYSQVDEVRLALSLQRRQTGPNLFVRPTNTGFGLSFVLGIVVAGLAAGPDTILIIENPEAHLHPRAQSSVGEFLARVSAGGTQVFVETHSEHVLNGIRRMVKQTILSPEGVQFFYFSKAPSAMEPTVLPISVSASGDISDWPDGFFDQLDKDLTVLLP